jgi:hypothetical protein
MMGSPETLLVPGSAGWVRLRTDLSIEIKHTGVTTTKAASNMKSDLQVIAAFLSPRPASPTVRVREPLAGPYMRITLSSALGDANTHVVYKSQPREEVKIKRMTPF